MPAYRLPSPYDRTPLQRRASSLALALAINLLLVLVLMTLGVIPPPSGTTMRGIVINFVPENRSASKVQSTKTETHRQHVEKERPVPKPPPIILPVKATIAPPPRPPKESVPWIEMSSADMAASDISKLPAAGSGSEGDSEVVGRGPNGEPLYGVEWAREPTNAELGGYLPPNPPEGYGEIACKTIPGDRVDDCIEIGQQPRGSHLASAVRQAAWQFRIRPPRKGGHALMGVWILIHIDYSGAKSGSGGN